MKGLPIPRYSVGDVVYVVYNEIVSKAVVHKIDVYDSQYNSFLYELKELDTDIDIYYFEFRLIPKTPLAEILYEARSK